MESMAKLPPKSQLSSGFQKVRKVFFERMMHFRMSMRSHFGWGQTLRLGFRIPPWVDIGVWVPLVLKGPQEENPNPFWRSDSSKKTRDPVPPEPPPTSPPPLPCRARSGASLRVLQEQSAAETIVMPNGCLCCRVRGDLVEALRPRRGEIGADIGGEIGGSGVTGFVCTEKPR